MGANDHPNEASALRYIQENTSIPVPEVISSDWDCIGWTESMCWHQITTKLGRADYRIVVTHSDIATRNIMVRDGRIVAILGVCWVVPGVLGLCLYHIWFG